MHLKYCNLFWITVKHACYYLLSTNGNKTVKECIKKSSRGKTESHQMLD